MKIKINTQDIKTEIKNFLLNATAINMPPRNSINRLLVASIVNGLLMSRKKPAVDKARSVMDSAISLNCLLKNSTAEKIR
jgi:hypothetical protein